MGCMLPWSDDGGGQIGYHVARAKGRCRRWRSWALAGFMRRNPTVVPTHEDRVIPGLQAIAEAAHGHGMKLLEADLAWRAGQAERAGRLALVLQPRAEPRRRASCPIADDEGDDRRHG